MNKDLKKIITKFSVFAIPILIWIGLLSIVDPFNYFQLNNFISIKSKEKTAKKFNSLLYNTIAFKNNPSPNIIIGDSRIKRFPLESIKKLSGDDYFILHSNAAKLNEIIDLFWLTNKKIKLENVIIGINFNLYNEFAYANRVSEVEEMIQNPLLYIFNGNVMEMTFKASPDIILSGRRINESMGSYVADEVIKLITTNRVQLTDAKVLLLGITFKENCPDIRNTGVIGIVKRLNDLNINPTIFDPWANVNEVRKEYGIDIISKIPCNKYDAVILAVAHDVFRDIKINNLKKDQKSIVYDVKGFLENSTHKL